MDANSWKIWKTVKQEGFVLICSQNHWIGYIYIICIIYICVCVILFSFCQFDLNCLTALSPLASTSWSPDSASARSPRWSCRPPTKSICAVWESPRESVLCELLAKFRLNQVRPGQKSTQNLSLCLQYHVLRKSHLPLFQQLPNGQNNLSAVKWYGPDLWLLHRS